jgi:predicted DNA-binding protein with PD1-like motif
MNYREVTVTGEYAARLETGADWREEIETLAADVDAEAGWFSALGSVEDAEIWFYDQDDKAYQSVMFDEPLEVAACVGNVGLLDGELFAHTHAVLSRASGQTLSGHLNAGTVFAGECFFRAFEQPLVRERDESTELDLWL